MANPTKQAFANDPLSNLFIRIFIAVLARNDCTEYAQYTVLCTFRRIACTKPRRRGRAHKPWWGVTLKATVINVFAIEFTINIK